LLFWGLFVLFSGEQGIGIGGDISEQQYKIIICKYGFYPVK